MTIKIDDSKYALKGEGDNAYKQVQFDPDTDFLAVPLGVYTIQKLPLKKSEKFTQHEAIRLWFHAIEDPSADVVTSFGGDAGKYYLDFYKEGKVVKDWVEKKPVESLVASEHGAYLYAQTLAVMEEGKVYRGKFRMSKTAAKYTADQPLWNVVESDDAITFPSATYGNRSSSGQTRDAQIQDTLKHACRLLNVEKDTDLLDVLTALYGDKNKALDATLGLLH